MSSFETADHFALNIFHKRVLSGITGFITGGPGGAARGLLTGGGGGKSRPVKRVVDFKHVHPSTGRTHTHFVGDPSHNGAAACPEGFIKVGGTCVSTRLSDLAPGGPPFTVPAAGRDDRPVGDAVMGRYGAALVPGSMIVDRAVCLRGMHLADDGLCYNKGAITNKQRAWPRGRKPLLTGGEMRAISVAHRAAGRLTRTAVRLQEMGLIKKPVARKPPKKKP